MLSPSRAVRILWIASDETMILDLLSLSSVMIESEDSSISIESEL
jgi:hypothetical protein